MSRRSGLLLPLIFSAALFALYYSDDRSWLRKDWREPAGTLLYALALLPLVVVIVRAIDLVAFDVFASRRGTVRAPLLLREIVSIVLYVVAIIWAAKLLGYPITGFLTGGAVLAAVLGLALQETLGNLFAGIALHLEDSFDVGDVIRSGDTMGVVESVRWRGTRIRTFNNNIVIVPNALMARERLEVFPRRNLNARVLQIGVDYNVPPAMVIGVLTQAASHVDGVSRELPCFARVGGFADSAITYEVKYFTNDYSQRDRIDADIRKAAWYAFRRNGISTAFPIRMYQRYTPPQKRQHPEPVEIAERLANVDILSPLEPEALQAIAEAAKVRVYARGETIIEHGAAGDSMFIVHAGNVAVQVGTDEVARLSAGDFFGEMALLTGETRTADIVAVDDVVTIEIRKDALQPVLQNHPELADAISARVIERKGSLDSMREEPREAHKTILSRIRSYFHL